jgi:NAD(P)H-dependent FMN reductase
MVSALRLLLISGSTRAGSTNTAALHTVQAVAPADMSAVLYEGLAVLPAFNPDADQAPVHPAVAQLWEACTGADAVLFCTPEYAGSLPGSLKNLLDWTVGAGVLYGKPVAWINVAAEGRGAGAHAELRTVLGYVGAVVIEAACAQMPVMHQAVAADGTVTDSSVRAQLRTLLDTLARAVRSSAAL